MMHTTPLWPRDDAEAIRRALMVEGGHLFVHAGGYTRSYDGGGCVCGYAIEPTKAACVSAGLPVIDTRALSFDEAVWLAIDTPIIAVGVPPDPEPWRSLSSAPLRHVAARYRAAGADVLNMPDIAGAGAVASA